MSIQSCKFILGAIVGIGILLGLLSVNPACYAGGAVIIVPAEDSDVPQGSLIPDRRTKAVEKKVRNYKAKMREKQTEQPPEQTPQNESSKPDASQDDGN